MHSSWFLQEGRRVPAKSASSAAIFPRIVRRRNWESGSVYVTPLVTGTLTELAPDHADETLTMSGSNKSGRAYGQSRYKRQLWNVLFVFMRPIRQRQARWADRARGAGLSGHNTCMLSHITPNLAKCVRFSFCGAASVAPQLVSAGRTESSGQACFQRCDFSAYRSAAKLGVRLGRIVIPSISS